MMNHKRLLAAVVLVASTARPGTIQEKQVFVDGYAFDSILKEPHVVPLDLSLKCAVPTAAEWTAARKKNGPHTQRFIRVFGNDVVSSALKAEGAKRPFPVGSRIVKAKYLKATDRQWEGVGLMVRHGGTDFKDSGGWEFLYLPDGGDKAKTHEACAACHRSATATDYVFGKYER